MVKSVKQNIIVCGYQKSGTTWSTRLVAQLLDAPSLGYWGHKGKTFVTEGEERNSPLVCYQSHHRYEDLFLDEENIYKVIYIVRDPRDIVVSGIFHFNFYSSWLENFISNGKLPKIAKSILKKINSKYHSKRYKIHRMFEMLNKGDRYIDHCNWAWNDHVSPYLNNEDILVIKYEDLLLNGLESGRKILNHCDLKKSDNLIMEDFKSQSFEVKKDRFKKQGDQIKVKHMRKGVAGDWKLHLSEQDESYIKNNHGQIMEELGYI